MKPKRETFSSVVMTRKHICAQTESSRRRTIDYVHNKEQLYATHTVIRT